MEEVKTAVAPINANEIIPEEEMKILAISSLEYANSYYRTFHRSLTNPDSRFDNELLYQMAILSVEKYFVGLLARFDWAASHHMPVAMYKEAKTFDPNISNTIKETAIMVGKFEGICSVEGFGYHIPTREDLKKMDLGIEELKLYVEKRIAEI